MVKIKDRKIAPKIHWRTERGENPPHKPYLRGVGHLRNFLLLKVATGKEKGKILLTCVEYQDDRMVIDTEYHPVFEEVGYYKTDDLFKAFEKAERRNEIDFERFPDHER